MNIALIGASGRVGSRILAELVRRGHTVTAIARHPESIADLPGVTRLAGDANSDPDLAKQLSGHDAVVSAVRFSMSDPQRLIDTVKQSGVPRYLVVGGAGSLEVAPGKLLVDSADFPEQARPESRMGLDFLNRLRAETSLDWTFLSPARQIMAGERTGKFRLGGDQLVVDAAGNSSISFEDFAVALIDELERPAHSRARFTLAY